MQAEADCYAARVASPGEVRAAVAFLTDEDRDPTIAIIGDPIQRAAHIQECFDKYCHRRNRCDG